MVADSMVFSIILLFCVMPRFLKTYMALIKYQTHFQVTNASPSLLLFRNAKHETFQSLVRINMGIKLMSIDCKMNSWTLSNSGFQLEVCRPTRAQRRLF